MDSMLTGIAPDTGEGIVKAVITYEDEAGNETRFEKDLNLLVYEMSFDEGMEDIPMEPMEEEPQKKGLPMAAIIGIIVGVIAVIVIVVVIISKKKKAKKQKEDMDLLDGDDV